MEIICELIAYLCMCDEENGYIFRMTDMHIMQESDLYLAQMSVYKYICYSFVTMAAG